MRSAILVCALAMFASCGPDFFVPTHDGGATGGGSAGGHEGAGGGGAAGGMGSAGGMGTAGGTGTGGGSAPPACSPSTCLGCCYNGFCQNGDTASACGKNGQTCDACVTGTICLTSQSCGIDPESSWKVQPSKVEVRSTNASGSAWDVLGGAPDPSANLFCPSNATMRTANTPSVTDVFTASWGTGSCIMKAKELMALGFAVEVWDNDEAFGSDAILDRRTLRPDQASFLAGAVHTDNGQTCVDLTVTLTRQP